MNDLHTTVQCPYCWRPRIVSRPEFMLAGADGRGTRFAACDPVCYQAFASDLRSKLRWDTAFGYAA